MMNKSMIKAISICLVVFMVFSLSGCGETPNKYSEWIDLVDVTSSTPEEDVEQDLNTDTSSSDKKVKKVNKSEFTITKNGSSEYKIVVSLSNDGYDQGRLMQKVIKKTTNVSIPMITDNEENNGKPEIIIGLTERSLSTETSAKLGNNEYIIKTFSDGNVVILGDNATALSLAVNKFLKLYFGFDENSDKVGTEKVIPATLNIKESSFADYKLVWNDEFNDGALDSSKWGFQPYMAEQPNLLLYSDERVCQVKDGNLNLYAGCIKDANGNFTDKYYTNTSLTTSPTMLFKYGYLEMRAKVPFGKPAHPSFWLQSSPINAGAPFCMAETDIFEHFASKTPYLQYGIHKWYRDGSGEHYLSKNIERYTFKSESEAEQWHTYGFWWTPEKMYALVDGVIYGCKDITDETGDFGDRGDGMQAFRDYAYIIYNNWLVVKGNSSEKMDDSEYADPSDFVNGPVTYTIDYVRLYQLPGQGGIIDLNK